MSRLAFAGSLLCFHIFLIKNQLTTAEYLRPTSTAPTITTAEQLERRSLAVNAASTKVGAENMQHATSMLPSTKNQMVISHLDTPQPLSISHSSPNLHTLSTQERFGSNSMTPLALDMYASAAQLPLPDRLNERPLMNASNSSSGTDLLGHIHDAHEQMDTLYWNSAADKGERPTSSTSKLQYKQRALSLGSLLSTLELGLGYPISSVDAAPEHRSGIAYSSISTQERITAQASKNNDVLLSMLQSGADIGQNETKRVADVESDNEEGVEIDDDHLGKKKIKKENKKEYEDAYSLNVAPGTWGCCLSPSELPPMHLYEGKYYGQIGLHRSREQTRQLRQLLAEHKAADSSNEAVE